ncbi:MAG: hypothetical protein U0R19_37595 [Bryobacteraceae bacterium]
MSTKRVEIIFDSKVLGKVDIDKLVAAAEQLSGKNKTAADSTKGLKTAQDQLGDSVVANNLKFAALSATIVGYAAALKGATVDAAKYAARTQTLAVTVEQLAKVNNLSANAVRGVVEGLKQQGISTQEALGTVNKMIFAQLDLAKAQNIARVAQDAAVIAGVNSSQALEGIIHGVVTRQPEVLRTYGIIVDFERAFVTESRKLGRELTNQEKVQIGLNLVLREGAKITGVYEAAMGTAGKQMTSLTRHVDEAKNAVGDRLLPTFSRAISLLTEMAKYVKENDSAFADLGKTAIASTAAFAAFRLPLPLPGKIAASAAAFLGTEVFLNPNPIAQIREGAKEQAAAISDKKAALRADVEAKRIAPDIAQKQAEALDAQLLFLQNQVATNLARLLIARGKEKPVIGAVGATTVAKAPDARTLAQQVEAIGLGGGFSVFPSDIVAKISELEKPVALDDKPVVNKELLKRQQDEALAAMYAEKAKKAEKEINDFVLQSFEKSAESLKDVLSKFVNATPGTEARFLQIADQTTLSLTKELAKAVTPDQRSRAFSAFNREIQGQISTATNERFTRAASFRGPTIFDEEVGLFQSQELARANARSLELQNRKVRISEIETPDAAQRQIGQFNQQRIKALQDAAAYEERILQLTAGQGNQVSAILRAAQLRVSAAQKQHDIERQIAVAQKDSVAIAEAKARLDNETNRANREATLQLLELRKRERDEFKQGAERLFDALQSRGGAGARDFIRSQFLDTTGRKVFGNVAGLTFDQLRSAKVTLPGQGTAQNPSLLGKILQGTPFGLDPLNDPALRQVASLDKNTLATDRLTAALSGAALPGGSTAAGLGTLFPGIPTGVFQGGLGPIFSLAQRSTTVPGGTPTILQQIQDDQVSRALSIAPPGGKGGAKSLGTLGTGVALAGGAFGVISGIRQGGGRGALTAVGSAAATVAALSPEPISKAIATAVALGAAAVGSLLPDPKKKRDDEITRRIESARFAEPVSTTHEVDLFGRSVDFNTRGQVRVVIQQTNNFSAIDGQSLIDRRRDLADAVLPAIQEGHPLMREIQSQLSTQ